MMLCSHLTGIVSSAGIFHAQSVLAQIKILSVSHVQYIALDKRGYQVKYSFLISPQKHIMWYSLEVSC